MDLVSVIIPSYNSEKFIEKSINSVLNQTYKNLELIVIDDKSPDNSNKIVEKYMEKDKRIRLVKLNKNNGPAVSRNKGIEEAKGRYIAFLDSDDLWLPEKLEKQIVFMKKENIPFTYSSYYLIDEEDNKIGKFITRENADYYSLLKTNFIGCLTAIYDTKKLGKIYMPEKLKKHEDFATWLKILKKIRKTKGILEPLAIYRIRKNSVSSNKIKAAIYQWKIYRKIENLNIVKSVYYMSHYIYNGLRKYR